MARTTAIGSLINLFGYPRSGTTFLKSALDEIFPDYEFSLCRHTVWELKDDISKGNIPIVPFRYPLDSIGSWSIYRQENILNATHFNWHNDNLEGDIKFYLRINTEILKLKDSIVLMPFEKFADNIEFITQRISVKLGLVPNGDPDLERIKANMRSGIARLNLPRETKEIIETVKPQILQHPLYADTLSLYQRLFEASED